MTNDFIPKDVPKNTNLVGIVIQDPAKILMQSNEYS